MVTRTIATENFKVVHGLYSHQLTYLTIYGTARVALGKKLIATINNNLIPNAALDALKIFQLGNIYLFQGHLRSTTVSGYFQEENYF